MEYSKEGRDLESAYGFMLSYIYIFKLSILFSFALKRVISYSFLVDVVGVISYNVRASHS